LGLTDIWWHSVPSNLHPLSVTAKIVFSSIVAIFVTFMLVRNLPAGAYPEDEGLRVRNVFSSRFVPWDQIQGFSLKMWRWWNRQPMGHVEMSDGTALNISAIQANNIGGRAAQLAVDELNALLAERKSTSAHDGKSALG
jgi:hypothetical protein